METKIILRSEPWLTELANDMLKTRFMDFTLWLQKPVVFEFGSGASTLWLHPKCKELISIEHDQEWHETIKKEFELKGYKTNNLFLREQPYNDYVESFKDNTFDVIIVDGRNRNACIRSSIPKLKTNGWLVLDNSEREHYAPGISLMADWNGMHFDQKQNDKYGFTYPNWRTSIFIKP